MPFALICIDKPDALELRKTNRAAHLDYGAETGLIDQAGPILNDAGDMCGSIIILKTEDRTEAEMFARNDPYAKAELFASVDIRHWKRVIG